MRLFHGLSIAVLALFLSTCNELPKRILPGLPLSAGAAAPPGSANQGKLQVVHAAPTGTDEGVREVVAIFNRPMATAETPLALRPTVPGRTRWLGTHTLAFVPNEPLGPGSYRALVPAGARAADGTTLTRDHAWTFEVVPPKPGRRLARHRHRRTSRPLRLYARVSTGEALSPGREVRLWASGPVRLSDLGRRARFVLADGTKVRVKARYQYKRSRSTVLLAPARPLPTTLTTRVRLHIPAGFPAADNRAPTARDYGWSFRTRVRLRVSWLTCPSGTRGSLFLRFNEDIQSRQVARQLKISPGASLRLLAKRSGKRYLAMTGRFVPGNVYSIEVPVGVRGRGAAPMKAAYVRRCTIPAPRPQVRFAVNGTLLEQAAPKLIPVWTQRVPQVAVRLRRVPADRIVDAIRKPSSLSSLTVAHEAILPAHRRKRVQIFVDPSPVLTAGRGAALVEVEGLARDGRPLTGTLRHLLVNATDLGLTTKQSTGATLVWVTRLSTGKPVPGAKVTLRDHEGKVLGSAVSDGDGVAEVSAKLQSMWRGNYVIVRKEGDLAWLRTTENQWMFTPSSFDVAEWASGPSWRPGHKPILRGILFTERGIYRPGETVRFKAVLRRETAKLETAEGTRVLLRIRDSRGQQILSSEHRLGAFGTFSADVPLSEAAALGGYQASVRVVGGAWRSQVNRSFRVEEFKTPSFQVKVRPERRHWYPGEAPRVTVRGTYLFGAPMQGAPVAWTVTERDSWFTPPKHPRFVWRPGVSWWQGRHARPEARVTLSDEARLDSRGERVLDFAKAAPNKIYSFEAKVTGMDRAEIAGRAQVVVHPARFYLGALAEWDFLEVTETFRADLVVAAPDGSRISGVPIKAVVYQGRWDSVRKIHQGGTASFSSKAAPKVVGRCELTSGAKPARCEFQPKEGGSYVLWATARDPDGRKVHTAIRFYVIGRSTASWAASDSVKVTLRADRYQYRLGQTARILIQNPFPEAEALVTLERGRILKRFRQKLVGPAPALRIKVTEDLMPNVFVSVVLVRGRAAGPFATVGDDPRRPLMRVGHALIRVSAESRRMKVTVQPERSEYRPGDEVVVRLKALGPQGVPLASELAVWAVDEGVLSLVAYQTPDPVQAFHGFHSLGIMTSDNRYRYLRRRSFEEKGGKTGGGGGSAESAGPITRKVFRAVAFFDPAVRTNQAGEATVRFTLPDNLTTFRIMAVAATRGQRFGNGEAKIVSTKRLLLKPSLPRFVRSGDRFEAGVVVHNRTGDGGRVLVGLRARGIVLEGPAQQAVQVEEGRAREVRFALRAEKPGPVKLSFIARLGTEQDALEVTRQVQLPTVLQSVGLSGEAKGVARRHAVGPIADARTDAGGLEVVLSGSRLVGLAGGLAYLMSYPYGCAEQTTSRLLPLLALKDLAEATGEGRRADLSDMIRSGLRRLAKFQQASGGFGLWPTASSPDPWVSAYVMFAMATARDRGYPVEQPIVERGVAYLKRLVRGRARRQWTGRRWRRLRFDLSTRTYALYALAALGVKESSAAAMLFSRRADLDTAGRAILLRTLSRLGDRERAATLATELSGEARLDGASVRFPDFGRRVWRYYGSAVRTQALVLEALAVVAPEHTLVPALVSSILGARRGGRWRTTQESAYALFALTAAERAEAATGERSATVFVNGRKRMRATFGPGHKAYQRLWIPMADLGGRGADLVVSPNGGPIRYFARLLHAPATPPRAGSDRGLGLWRTYEPVSRPGPGAAALGAASPTQVRAGDLVRVTLHIAVPRTVEHVVVDDPLPAGLQVLNLSLATTAKTGTIAGKDPVFTHKEMRADRVVLYAAKLAPGLYRRTYLARAVTPGRFAAPSVRAEGMYEPERSGSTAATALVVLAPRDQAVR